MKYTIDLRNEILIASAEAYESAVTQSLFVKDGKIFHHAIDEDFDISRGAEIIGDVDSMGLETAHSFDDGHLILDDKEELDKSIIKAFGVENLKKKEELNS
jgi:hypothetical protein